MRGLVNEVGTAIKEQNGHIFIPDFEGSLEPASV